MIKRSRVMGLRFIVFIFFINKEIEVRGDVVKIFWVF